MSPNFWFGLGISVGIGSALAGVVLGYLITIPLRRNIAAFEREAEEARERIRRGCRQTDGDLRIPPRGGSSTAGQKGGGA